MPREEHKQREKTCFSPGLQCFAAQQLSDPDRLVCFSNCITPWISPLQTCSASSRARVSFSIHGLRWQRAPQLNHVSEELSPLVSSELNAQ